MVSQVHHLSVLPTPISLGGNIPSSFVGNGEVGGGDKRVYPHADHQNVRGGEGYQFHIRSEIVGNYLLCGMAKWVCNPKGNRCMWLAFQIQNRSACEIRREWWGRLLLGGLQGLGS